MSGEFDKDGIGWFIANDYLYAVNQETLNGKDIHCRHTFSWQFIQVDSKNRVMVIYWQGKIFI
jgi:hypothetical protein